MELYDKRFNVFPEDFIRIMHNSKIVFTHKVRKAGVVRVRLDLEDIT